VYAFDVVTSKSGKTSSVFPILRNRRTFAVAETGLPDGIKLDVPGNVYTGTGAGVEVFAPSGKRLGSILIEGGVANLVFADKVLYALNEKRIIAVQLRVPGAKLPYLVWLALLSSCLQGTMTSASFGRMCGKACVQQFASYHVKRAQLIFRGWPINKKSQYVCRYQVLCVLICVN
jgi:hypothetical protein